MVGAALLIVVSTAIIISILSTTGVDTIVAPASSSLSHPQWQSQTGETKKGD